MLFYKHNEILVNARLDLGNKKKNWLKTCLKSFLEEPMKPT